MRKKQVTQKKQAYISPAVEVFCMGGSAQIMETSFPGQHTPGHHGSGPNPSGAKQAGLFEEEDGTAEIAEENPWGKPWQ